ncbi:MAG TPA: hypothetical protein VGK31_09685 [Thermoanaerobaculia bacterium]
MRLRSLLLFVVVFASVARAQIIAPTPKAGEPFEIRIDAVTGDCPAPSNPRLFIAGKNIFLTFTSAGGCPIPNVTPWQTSVAVPGLGAGRYHVELRLISSTVSRFAETDFAVTGPPPGIEISPTFDANAGNRVVKIRGSFPCAASSCPPPTVLFGTKSAEGVERISENELDVVVPFQTNVRFVDLTVRGENYTYFLPSGFTYVGSDYRPILLPVYTTRPVAGAFGSLWQAEFRIVNLAHIPLVPGIDILYANGDFPSDQVKSPALTMPRDDVDSPPIALAWIRQELAPFVSVELRVRDLSRQSETWGTEIPVVFGGKYDLNLIDVPVREGFRSLLRVYSAVYGGCCGVIVTFKAADGHILTTRSFQLQHPNGSIGGLVPPPYKREGSRELSLQPAYAEIDLQSIAELAGQETVWIQVSPTMASWAFASVTNDATQHVTTITPR